MDWLKSLVTKLMAKHGKRVHFLAAICVAVIATLALTVYLVPEEKDNVLNQVILLVALIYIIFYVHITAHHLRARSKKWMNDKLGIK